MTVTEATSRAGEYLVAYRLEMAGIRTVHVNMSGHDLWCHTPSGRIISVQVKASASPATGLASRHKYEQQQLVAQALGLN